jgi:hypothetical protein
MITFKEFLIEKKMSASVYALALKRLEDDAKIGFEIEVFVPTRTFFHAGPDSAPASKPLMVNTIKKYSEILAVFDVPDAVDDKIRNEYAAWSGAQEEAWVDEHWENFVTDEESRTAEKDARRSAAKNAKEHFTWADWIKDELGSISTFIATFDLEPKFGWSTDNTAVFSQRPEVGGYASSFKNTASTMAKFLEKVLKEPVGVNATGYDHWNLTHDTSIKDSEGRSDEEDQDGVGVEIVSPPLAPTLALEQLAAVLNILDTYGIETNESTGIHVNISLSNMENFDPLKLVLFMGDEHVLKKFDRSTNAFTQSQIKRVIDSISLTGKLPKTADELITVGREGLAETGKYFSVNLQHLPKYLEFRAAGGKDYHRRLRDIREVVGRWLTAVELAAHPEMQRQEYLKKVMKLIDKTSEAEAHESQKDLTFEQMLYNSSGKMAWDTLQDALAGNDKAYKLNAVRVVLVTLARHVDELQPTLPSMKEFRMMFRQAGVSPEQVLAGEETSRARGMTEVLKKFKFLAKPSIS